MKKKSLGKANDVGVPKDEMDLAKLVQNARAHGLGWCGEYLYVDHNGLPTDNYGQNTVACCAIGATLLSKDTGNISVMAAGNDKHYYPDRTSYLFNDELGFVNSYMIGAGFRCAMKDDDIAE